MLKAVNSRNQNILATNVEVANSMRSRLVGLIGRASLSDGSGMLIKRSGNSIHTFFMKFAIDLLFIDKKGEVRWLIKNVAPWKLVWAPTIYRTDCLELPSGIIEKTQTQLGDIIRVES